MTRDQLTERLLQGDEAALAELFKTLNPVVVGLAAAISGNRATGEEVAQEAWLTVIDRIESFRHESILRTWILTITANKARTRARRDARSVSLNHNSDVTAGRDRFNENGKWIDPPARWDILTPERILAGRETWRLVEEEIKSLPSIQQAILALTEKADITPREAARILGLSPGNLRVHLHRAREKIRRRLEAEWRVEKNISDDV